MKICTKCKVEKDESEFSRDSQKSDGLRSSCKVCKSKSARKYRESNKEKVSQAKKDYYYNRGGKEKVAEYSKQWADENREHLKEYKRQWHEKNDSPGIYKITCLANDKVYYGSTKQIKNRWQTHRGRLRSGGHENKKMVADWNKFGEDAFKYEVLEECSISELKEKENALLKLHARKPYCYNTQTVSNRKKA